MSRSTFLLPDAIVVGARVAGASTALLLARAGLRVLVLDRARRGSDTLSTHALMRGGVLQLQRWGLLDAIVASGAPAIRRVTFHYGPQTIPITIKPQAGVTALYAPRRTVLDPVLVDAAEAAGAEVRFGVTVTDVVRNDAGRVIGVTVRDARGRSWSEHARIVVGADGRNSVIAERVSAPVVGTGHHVGTWAYGYWPVADVDGYHWSYGDHVSGGVIPTNDGLACVFACGPAKPFERRSPEVALRRIARRLGGPVADLAAVSPVGRVRFFRGLTGRLRRPYGPGWALVGDAGAWLDPLSTHGITEALREAELLTDALLGGSDSDEDLASALITFQMERDRILRPLLKVTDQLASHRWDLRTARRLLGGLSDLMADEVAAIRGAETVPARIA
jgi:flavin-dependent dehydrogenase